MTTIGIVLFDGAEELDFVGPWEVFTASAILHREAGQEPDRVRLIAQATGPVSCAKGMRVLPDVTFAKVDALDVVPVPGGIGTRREVDNEVLLGWLRDAAARARWVSAITKFPQCEGLTIT